MKHLNTLFQVAVVVTMAGSAMFFMNYQSTHSTSYVVQKTETPTPAPAPETSSIAPTLANLSPPPAAVKVKIQHTNPSVPASPPKLVGVQHQTIPVQKNRIDPIRLEQAELDLVRHRLYEQEAMETLPTLSVQTHNPVWQLEYEAKSAKTENTSNQQQEKPHALPAPVSGPYGNMQPPEGEIWLRIPPEYAAEHKSIMAENLDLYRTETGYIEPVTITLWVGGKPFIQEKYQ